MAGLAGPAADCGTALPFFAAQGGEAAVRWRYAAWHRPRKGPTDDDGPPRSLEVQARASEAGAGEGRRTTTARLARRDEGKIRSSAVEQRMESAMLRRDHTRKQE